MIRQIWILIAKKLSGDASEEDLRELNRHSEEAGFGYTSETLQNIFNSTTTTNEREKEELDERWLRFEQTWKRRGLTEGLAENTEAGSDKGIVNRIWWARLFRYAAIALLSLSVGYIFWPVNNNDVVTAMEAPDKGVSKMILPDGSSVWLNSGSKISYKNNSKTNCREVLLTGEAYFDVVKDPKKPFIVTTPSFTIKVLGTAFNVKSYEKSGQSEATLVHGKIELALLERPETRYILEPSQKLTVTNVSSTSVNQGGKKPGKSPDEFLNVELTKVHDSRAEGLPVEVLWFKDTFDFDNATFGEVATMMEHRYNVKLTFKDQSLSDIKFSGKFREETLEEALKELKEIIDFDYQIRKNEILIY